MTVEELIEALQQFDRHKEVRAESFVPASHGHPDCRQEGDVVGVSRISDRREPLLKIV